MEKPCETTNAACLNVTVNGAKVKLIFSKESNLELPEFIKKTLLSAYIQKAAV